MARFHSSCLGKQLVPGAAVMALVMALLLCLPGSLQAVDFRVKGVWQMAFQYSNVTPKGVDGADRFGALQRFRTQIDAVASENLSGSVTFEIGDVEWGKSASGGALGADGKIVELRYAYLDWVAANISTPFVAIGGIKEHNIAEVAAHGAKCCALVSELVGAEDIVGKVAAVRRAMHQTA